MRALPYDPLTLSFLIDEDLEKLYDYAQLVTH